MQTREQVLSILFGLSSIFLLAGDIVVLLIANLTNENKFYLLTSITTNAFLIALTLLFEHMKINQAVDEGEETTCVYNYLLFKKCSLIVFILGYVCSCIVYISCKQLTVMQIVILLVIKFTFGVIYFMDILQSKYTSNYTYNEIKDTNQSIQI